MKTYSGFNAKTAERLFLDSGAFYKNYDVSADTPESACDKLLGATRGGGEFNAVPTMREIEIDGIKTRGKGLSRIDNWDINILANMIEVTPQILADALGASDIDIQTDANYDIIKGRNYVKLDDYIDNITWIGTLSGSDKPIIIQIYNALGSEGIAIAPVDNDEGILPVRFLAHQDATDCSNDSDNAPFAIYYPKVV